MRESRFSNNDASYKMNDSYKFKANGYDSKPKLPTTASASAAPGASYPQAYNGYGAEALFSYPPPPIH